MHLKYEKLMPGRICALALMPGQICALELMPGRIQSKMRQYTFTSTILHLLINILLEKKLYNEAEVHLKSKLTG